jgi:hypothetical protein
MSRDALRIYGAVMFTIYSSQKTDWLNRERSVGVMNDGGVWKFWAEGRVQPFEELERYGSRRLRDRFTYDMLNRYCLALGLCPFDETFYGQRGVVFNLPGQWNPGDPSMSLDDARRLTDLR